MKVVYIIMNTSTLVPITMRVRGRLYRISKAAFETNERTFERGWHIVKSTKSIDSPPVNTNYLINMSHECVNEKKGMKYAYA